MNFYPKTMLLGDDVLENDNKNEELDVVPSDKTMSCKSSYIPSSGDDCIASGPIFWSNEVNDSIGMEPNGGYEKDMSIKEVDEGGTILYGVTPTSINTLVSDNFNKLVKAYLYLERDPEEVDYEPDFSVVNVSRLAIDLYRHMLCNGYTYICDIEHKNTWHKDHLSEFITNLFETLLDFLEAGQNDISKID